MGAHVHGCMKEREKERVSERVSVCVPVWIFVLTCNIKLASGPFPLYLPCDLS